MSGAHREAIQKQIHQDWANREYIEVITASIKRITDFLNSFGKWFLLHTCFIHTYEHDIHSFCRAHPALIKLIISHLHIFYTNPTIYISRYVLSVSACGFKWKINNVGTSHRLLGSMRDSRGNINVILLWKLRKKLQNKMKN